MKGAIICGYQGIGKSTLANPENGYIDLESGNFWVDGRRDKEWYIIYCNIAIHLAKQGYKVFLSSHEVVREHLAGLPTDPEVELLLCFPSIELEMPWIGKLGKRFCETRLDKDWKAWMGACSKYAENIHDLREQKGFRKVMLTSMTYDLQNIIDTVLEES